MNFEVCDVPLLELSLKSLHKSWFDASVGPFSTFYVKMNSLSNFQEHHFRCLTKVCREICSYTAVFWLKSNASPSFH